MYDMDWSQKGGRVGTGGVETRQHVLTWRRDWIAVLSRWGPKLYPGPKSTAMRVGPHRGAKCAPSNQHAHTTKGSEECMAWTGLKPEDALA